MRCRGGQRRSSDRPYWLCVAGDQFAPAIRLDFAPVVNLKRPRPCVGGWRRHTRPGLQGGGAPETQGPSLGRSFDFKRTPILHRALEGSLGPARRVSRSRAPAASPRLAIRGDRLLRAPGVLAELSHVLGLRTSELFLALFSGRLPLGSPSISAGCSRREAGRAPLPRPADAGVGDLGATARAGRAHAPSGPGGDGSSL